MNLLQFLTGRLAKGIAVLFAIAVLNFFLIRAAPGVLALVLDRLPATLLLTGAAFVISLGLGVMMGALAARRAGRWSDSLITTLSLVFYATPLFWIALIGQHLFPPALTLVLFFTALYARMMRASMLEVAGADFVKTARAKGLTPGIVSRRHVARNAILPVVTLAGLQAGQLVGGAVLTETVFAWPGIGRLMFDALVQRDYSVLLGVFFMSSAMVVGFNILTDLVYRIADPRIEAGA